MHLPCVRTHTCCCRGASHLSCIPKQRVHQSRFDGPVKTRRVNLLVSSAPPCAGARRRGHDVDGSGGGCATRCVEAASSSPFSSSGWREPTDQRARASPHAFQGNQTLPEAPGPRILISPFIYLLTISDSNFFSTIFNSEIIYLYSCQHKSTIYTHI